MLFDDGHDYTAYWMYFTMNNGTVATIDIIDSFGRLVNDENNRKSLMSIAKFILWYESIPDIIVKEKTTSGSSKEISEDEVGDICSICYDEYQKGQMIAALACKHTYHEGCINNWLSRKRACPNCRAFTKLSIIYSI
nr:hypothetical protein [Tanacetum cinerariifolium]